MTGAKRRLRRWLARVPLLESLARVTVETIRVSLRYRVTGLASEAGFFALLSLPPLVLGLFGGVGYVGRWMGPVNVGQVRSAIEGYAANFVTEDVIDSVLGPTINDVFQGGRFELVSLGFLLSLWSGSRAVNVFVDTVSIMYGQSGERGIVRTRALSFSIYSVGLLVGIVTIPLVLLGPSLLGTILPDSWEWLVALYWPFVTVLTAASLTSLYHVSTPRRSPWSRDIPGAVLTLVIWVIASFVVRGAIAASVGGTSIYGPLSAPIVLLIWLYALAIAVLIGAAFNAAIRKLWPSAEERGLRERLADKVRTIEMPSLADLPVVSSLPGVGRGAPEEGAQSSAAEGARAPEAAGADEVDDLGLSGVREAAGAPLTPVRVAVGRRHTKGAGEADPGPAKGGAKGDDGGSDEGPGEGGPDGSSRLDFVRRIG